MRTGEIGRNSPDQTVWWRVDLGKVYNIYSINIMFKNYDGLGKLKTINKSKNVHRPYSFWEKMNDK